MSTDKGLSNPIDDANDKAHETSCPRCLRKTPGEAQCDALDEYVEFALYDGQTGYYATNQERVGRSAQSDFLTSSSFGGIWGELILNACGHILQDENLNLYTFVEIAAEPDHLVLLKSITRSIKPKSFAWETRLIFSPAIVYSNEWLDAQAFKRFLFNPGG